MDGVGMTNLTPHAITLQRSDGLTVTFPASGILARVTSNEVVCGEAFGVPVISRSLGSVVGLLKNGGNCLVSALVLSACPGVVGLYAPDSGPTAIRDERGHVIAVTRLVKA